MLDSTTSGARLLSLLQSFSSSELTSLQKFLASPLFNRQEKYVQLFNYLRERKFQLSSSRHYYSAFAIVSPALSFDAKSMNREFSHLNKLVEQFIVISSLKAQPLIETQLLHAGFLKRGFSKRADKVQLALKKQSQPTAHSAPQRHLSSFQLYAEKLKAPTAPDEQNYGSLLRSAFGELDQFYFAQRLYLETEQYNRSRIVSDQSTEQPTEVSNQLYPALKRLIDVNLSYRFHLKEFLKNSTFNEEKYDDFLARLTAYLDAVTPTEGSDALRLLFNYTYWHSRHFRPHTQSKLLQLYKIGLQKSAFVQHGRLNGRIFTNAVTCGLASGEFEWTRQFIYDYVQLVPEEARREVKDYANAQFSYFTGEYQEVIQRLEKSKFSSIELKLNSKILATRASYELVEVDLLTPDELSTTVENNIRYVKKHSGHRLAKPKEVHYLNFYRLVQCLLKHTRTVERLSHRRKIVTNQIESCKQTLLRDWLLKKAASLK